MGMAAAVLSLLLCLCPAGTNWTSGALYSDEQRNAAAAAATSRLQVLKANEELPLVWFDVSIKGTPVGRIHFVLFVKDAPRAGGVQAPRGLNMDTRHSAILAAVDACVAQSTPDQRQTQPGMWQPWQQLRCAAARVSAL